MSRPTIYDVARLAGVGISTVSRVMNNSDRVRFETQQRVLQAIQALNYTPNTAARRLSNQVSTQNIGVITVPFLDYHSYVERLRGMQQTLNQQDDEYELLLYSASSTEAFNRKLDRIVQTSEVDALVIIDFVLDDNQLDQLEGAGLPYIVINHHVDAPYQRIGASNYLGARHAADYFYGMGHRHIGYIGEHLREPHYGFTTSQERFLGFSETLSSHGIDIPTHWIQLGAFGYEDAVRLTHQMLDSTRQIPSAIFAMSDIQALGCISAVRSAGYDVPGDISVLGYDDIEMSRYLDLTTVRQHLTLSGTLSIRYLIDLLQERTAGTSDTPERDIILPHLPAPQVIERATVRRIDAA